MHELGLVIDAVEMTERYAGENNIEQIKALVLRICAQYIHNSVTS